MDKEIAALNEEYRMKQQDITNARVSQSIRRSQIARLSGLAQPIELDHTYFFVNRYPTTADTTPAKIQTKATKFKMRTGDMLLLEGRLEEITRHAENKLTTLFKNLSAVNTTSECVITSTPESIALRKSCTDALEQVDNMNFQLFSTVLEILRLRLKIMITQREEIELREEVAQQEDSFGHEISTMQRKTDGEIRKMKERYDEEHALRVKTYHRQLKQASSALKRLDDTSDMEKLQRKYNKYKALFDAENHKYVQLRKRHALEVEGYSNEAKLLRARLKHLARSSKQVAIDFEL